MRAHILTTLFLATAAFCGAIPVSHVVHEKREVAGSRWVKRDRLDPRTVLPMRIGLKQSNLERGPEFLMDVSHPGSPNYGKHWTSEEVTAMFAPSDDTVEAVREWIVGAGGIHPHRITHTDNKAWLAFDVTVQEAESMLHAEFHEYEHAAVAGETFAACDQYHLPKKIQEHVDFVYPGVKAVKLPTGLKKRRDEQKKKRGFGKPTSMQPPKIRPAPKIMPLLNETANCDSVITPICIQALYGIPPPDPNSKVDPSNTLGIFEEGDTYAQGDLDLFFANFTPQIPLGTHPIPNFVDGAVAPVPIHQSGGESMLDFELVYPLIYPQTVTLYQTDDSFYADGGSANATGIFNTFLDALDGSYCNYTAFGETGNDPVLDPVYPDPNPGGYKGALQCGVYTPAKVISISYGEQEQDLPAYYQQRQCNEFLKLGLQGTSIFVASGDTGVGGLPGDGARNGCLGANATIFSPTQPNSCPWLTNVGATKVYPGRTVYEPESAALDVSSDPIFDFSSGGGFSNIFEIPDYQAGAIDSYFKKHDPPYSYYVGGENLGANGGIYNRAGRGIPDVAANGDNIGVFVGGRFRLEGGTSASSPIFAAIVNRINEERLAAGKSSVGFINPVLYSHPEVLNDITNGTNPGCGTPGFSSVKGWDPVTGLGTPNFPKMLKLFMSLP